MTREVDMDTKYNPTEVEKGRYKTWLDQGVFKPSGDKKAKPYSIVIPPPNVTGKLHLGHAWDTTIQDTLIRYKRMQGYDTLYLPGMDHAGIATQAKVEAKLREQGITRYDLGRDKFIDEVWKWKDEFAGIIKDQWGKLGLSLDYDRERFTLDEGLSKAVRKVFVKLYNEGLIYRGEYIINWDPELQTALSDIEVIHKDDKGAFYHVKYPYADGSGYIEIATTRPETMFGDVAVAVNPSDERYKDVVGKEIIVPLVDRKIPIITDQYVTKDFGTGMVKITPAHDPNDFLVGNRHDLKRINTMNADGTMNENAGKYVGMDRFEARKAIVADLEDQDYMLKVEPITHSVGHSERSGAQVEARLSTQWFVKMKPLAEMALKNQEGDNKVNFVPERFEGTFTQWMDNVHDWVISRQLWWGHRIPAWYNNKTGETYVGEEDPKDPENWTQDSDVLDTWFSSALWPFSTMGWPDEDSDDYKRYFPTNTLVTGYDIIFFWVSRMIFTSLKFTEKRPFEHVVIHGLIRDEQGRKMSKSLGNGIDPMDVIDKYGADALRWFLMVGSTPGQDTRFSYDKMDSAWNFINKIWNASRFVIMNLDDKTPAMDDLSKVKSYDLSDKWILAKLNTTVNEVTRLLDKFEFGEAGRNLYNFIWNDFCDWYIEMSKATLTGEDGEAKDQKRMLLTYVLDKILRLMHPIMPFVTEKIWLSMPHNGESISLAAYPENHDEFKNDDAVEQMEVLIDLIKSVRKIRLEANAPLSSAIDIFIKPQSEDIKNVLLNNKEYIDRFAHPKELKIETDLTAPELAMTAVTNGTEVYIPLAELIDLDEEIARQQEEMKKMDDEISRINKKLSNENFVKKAPEKVVAEQKEKLADYQTRQEKISQRIEQLQKNK
ncbi:valine--tRNA ligase [Companilactobacillus mishanensis]|uniref:Valine--tRNA ligase n=1 Tax=Companilactobacillus mishanensis TaxID=2486008 RepID=A0A5P0ZGT6_9LACO|nr:valine--tRNA ligase [Companilactobacillus mishanensis]MQS44035.1 valine--tRNA ligase [Companilactobacillus mishanensis]MQS52244.1 valine--tRNA ligase [Companilactobacillus mishanensis]MQS88334.1 valine--tRNA ligase [Companilactobacillus mishanensis]